MQFFLHGSHRETPKPFSPRGRKYAKQCFPHIEPLSGNTVRSFQSPGMCLLRTRRTLIYLLPSFPLRSHLTYLTMMYSGAILATQNVVTVSCEVSMQFPTRRNMPLPKMRVNY